MSLIYAQLVAILEKTERALAAFRDLPPDVTGGKDGGYLTIRQTKSGQMLACVALGAIPTDKQHKYAMLSQEKSYRLFHYSQHSTSWQSREPGIYANGFQKLEDIHWGFWGGAIRAGKYILSFSGLPEMGDEALVLTLAVLLDLLSVDQAREIAAISNNQVFEPLFDLVSSN